MKTNTKTHYKKQYIIDIEVKTKHGYFISIFESILNNLLQGFKDRNKTLKVTLTTREVE
jgi:hypothetical protein